MSADISAVSSYLLDLQDRICEALEAIETSQQSFDRQVLERARGGLARFPKLRPLDVLSSQARALRPSRSL